MGEVKVYGTGVKNPASQDLPPVQNAEGRMRQVTSRIAVTSGDSINSKHYLAKVPSSAIPDPSSLLYHEAITSLNDYDIGLEYQGQAVGAADLLANGLDLSSAGSKSIFAAIATADLGKPLWQIAGKTADPGVTYDIVGTLKAAAGATKTIVAFTKYART